MAKAIAAELRPMIEQIYKELKGADEDLLPTFPDLMTKAEVAQALRVDMKTVYNLTYRDNALPKPGRQGKKAVYPKAAIVNYLRNQINQ